MLKRRTFSNPNCSLTGTNSFMTRSVCGACARLNLSNGVAMLSINVSHDEKKFEKGGPVEAGSPLQHQTKHRGDTACMGEYQTESGHV